MPLAVDVSSPARVTGSSTNGTLTVTSPSFDAPAGLLVVTVQCNHRNEGSVPVAGVMSNNGAALTWTLAAVAEENAGDLNAYAAIFTAQLPTARTGLTVTFTANPGTATTVNTPTIKAYVVTGAKTSGAVGATLHGNSTTNNLTTAPLTTQAAGSLGFVSASEWNALGTASSSDTTYDARVVPGTSPKGIGALSGYKTLGAAGSSATFNLDAAGTGTSDAAWNWAAVEILAQPIAPGEPWIAGTARQDGGGGTVSQPYATRTALPHGSANATTNLRTTAVWRQPSSTVTSSVALTLGVPPAVAVADAPAPSLPKKVTLAVPAADATADAPAPAVKTRLTLAVPPAAAVADAPAPAVTFPRTLAVVSVPAVADAPPPFIRRAVNLAVPAADATADAAGPVVRLGLRLQLVPGDAVASAVGPVIKLALRVSVPAGVATATAGVPRVGPPRDLVVVVVAERNRWVAA